MKSWPYDGIKLEEKNKSFKLGEKYEDRDCKWRKKPCDVPLLSNVGWVSPTGIEGKMDRLDQEDDKNQIVNYNYKLDLSIPSLENDFISNKMDIINSKNKQIKDVEIDIIKDMSPIVKKNENVNSNFNPNNKILDNKSLKYSDLL